MGIAFEKGEAMNYVLNDIHNDYKKFCEMLHVIHFSETDRLYVLGDLFDRCDYDPNPVDLYFNHQIFSRRKGSVCRCMK